jgi:hypothetical protein
MSSIHCDSNQRCEACPIERLSEASDRVKAGDITRRVIRTLVPGPNYVGIEINELGTVARQRASGMGAGELASYVVGAVAINLSGQCE